MVNQTDAVLSVWTSGGIDTKQRYGVNSDLSKTTIPQFRLKKESGWSRKVGVDGEGL